MLCTLHEMERLLQLCDPFLEVIVMDNMHDIILQAVFAGLQSNASPMFLLRFLFTPLCVCEYGHVVFFQQRLSLIPSSSTRMVEKALLQQLTQQFVLTFVLFSASKHRSSFMYDACIHPCWR
ncbi:unnamed protein product [Periconia digitata]|uniref:Uncharacterized protein n=1 Tax=Periconia digitata TaxID=1303443 RepID=A0A9W4U5D3_9PLEO|nr:unnamed protein product [Periconia digitata]